MKKTCKVMIYIYTYLFILNYFGFLDFFIIFVKIFIMEELMLLKKFRLLAYVENEFHVYNYSGNNIKPFAVYYITWNHHGIVKFRHFKPGYGIVDVTYREVFDTINRKYGTDYLDVMKIVKKLLLEHHGNGYVVKFKKYKGKLNHI